MGSRLDPDPHRQLSAGGIEPDLHVQVARPQPGTVPTLQGARLTVGRRVELDRSGAEAPGCEVAARAGDRAVTAASTAPATSPTRSATACTCRLTRRPVAHHVAKCSQLSTTGQ